MVTAICLVIVLSCGSGSEKTGADAMRQLVPQEILGWTIQESAERYDRETIFDYIDGAGEVYLSYGFRSVSVFHYVNPGSPEITVEIFDMGSAEDAYGVFTHARESEGTGIGQAYEYRGSLLCFWKGRHYVCVVAEKETPHSKNAVFMIARVVDQNITESARRPTIIASLPEDGLDRTSIRYFHTHALLNYHYFLAEDNLFNLDSATEVVLAAYAPGMHLVCIRYPSPEQAAAGYDKFITAYVPEAAETGAARIEQGTWVAALHENDYVIVAFDGPDEERARRLVEACGSNVQSAQ